MYGSGGNYGYGRNAMPSTSKNQQHGKYTGSNVSGYGLGQSGSGSATFGSTSTKAAGRTRDSQSYGTTKQNPANAAGATGGAAQQRKSIYDRAQNTSTSKPAGAATGGYTPNSSIGLSNGRGQNGSSALASGTTAYGGQTTGGGSYAQNSNILSQSYKQKSNAASSGSQSSGYPRQEFMSYGAYGIAKNNKMSDSGRQIVGSEGERVVSRGHNGRAIINGRKDKVEEAKRSSVAAASIRTTKNYQQYAFGDNYGHTREFQKPDQDEAQQAADATTLLRKGHSQHEAQKSTSIRQQRLEEEKSTEPTSTKLVSSLKSSQKGFEGGFGSSGADKLDLSKKSVSEVIPKGYGYSATGLSNIGNTCFMNSILQCIFATAPLTKYFMTDYSSEKPIRTRRLADSYYALLKNARLSRGGSIAPSELKQQISRVARQFSGYGQQDAQEFLRFLLDGMHNELNRIEQKPKYKEIECDKLPIDQQSQRWSEYFAARDNSIITDLFEGQLCSKIQCQKCNHKSYTFDNFMDLSVQIPRKAVRYTGYIDVDECLKTFTATEKMENCGYKCSSCKGIDNMEKDISIFKFPRILVVHLKRFYNSSMRREKLSTTIQIPTTLDMRPYGPHSNHPSKNGAKNYKLYGISHHSGTLHGGHYIGDVMNIDDGSWYNCNDSRCKKQISADTNSTSAYVLFYMMQ